MEQHCFAHRNVSTNRWRNTVWSKQRYPPAHDISLFGLYKYFNQQVEQHCLVHGKVSTNRWSNSVWHTNVSSNRWSNTVWSKQRFPPVHGMKLSGTQNWLYQTVFGIKLSTHWSVHPLTQRRTWLPQHVYSYVLSWDLRHLTQIKKDKYKTATIVIQSWSKIIFILRSTVEPQWIEIFVS